MSEDFRLIIPLWGSFFLVFFAANGCFVFIQYNLLNGYCESNLIQPWTQVIDYLFLGLTGFIRLRIGIFHLSISGIVVVVGVIFPIAFIFLLFCYFIWLFVGWSYIKNFATSPGYHVVITYVCLGACTYWLTPIFCSVGSFLYCLCD